MSQGDSRATLVLMRAGRHTGAKLAMLYGWRVNKEEQTCVILRFY